MTYKNLYNWFDQRKYLIIILVTAFIIRFAYIVIFKPPITWFDADLYDTLAFHLISGQGYSVVDNIPSAPREPGYIFAVLVPTYLLFGHSYLAVQMIQVLLSIAVIYLVYKLGARKISKNVGMIAAILLAVHHSSIIYAGEILTENIFTFLLLLGVLMFIQAEDTQSKKDFILAGLTFGIATLTRFNAILIFIALFLGPMLLQNWRKIVRKSIVIATIMIIVISPWIIRNYIQLNRFIPGRMGAGQIIWSGSYIPWDGDWLYHPNNTPMFREKIKGVPAEEQDEIFLKEAWKNIRENPFRVLLIWLKKPFKILLPDEIVTYLDEEKLLQYPQLFFLTDYMWQLRFLKVVMQIFHLLLLGFSLYGFRQLYEQEKKIAVIMLSVILYFIASYLPMNAVPRYLVPLWPYIILFAAVGIQQFFKQHHLYFKHYE